MSAMGTRLFDLAFGTGQRRRLDGLAGEAVRWLAAGTTLWVIYAAAYSRLGVLVLTVLFLSLMLTLTFLAISPSERTEQRINKIDLALAVLAALTGGYFLWQSETIEQRIALLTPLTHLDVAAGLSVTLLTLEAMRRTVGLGLTSIVVLFIAYNLFGHALPGALGHGYISLHHFLDITIFTTDGLFGVPLRVAGTYVFLFVLFGTILAKTGGSEFFFQLAASISGKQKGGPAKVAVVSSGLYGTISGSPTSDVVTTGSITIPMMERAGYRPHIAAAVEVASSTGGSLLPPVMGSAAFIMAEYTGIPYREIVIAGVLPALLYYLAVFLQVDLRARKLNLPPIASSEIKPLLDTFRRGGLFVVPLVAVTWALLDGYTPTFSAIFGVIASASVGILYNLTKVDVKRQQGAQLAALGNKTLDLLAETAQRMIAVSGACAAAGLVIGGITMTGLAGKFSSLVFLITGESAFLSLFFAGALTIILGLGMPTPSAYILAAVLVAPILAELGFMTIAAHMFLLYFAVMSALTPPVAVAAYAASAIANANPLRIAGSATRMAAAAFVLPFFFVYNPGLLMQGSWLEVLSAVLIAIFAIILFAAAFEGYFRRNLRSWERIMLVAAGLSLLTAHIIAIVCALVAIGVVSINVVRRVVAEEDVAEETSATRSSKEH